MLISILLLTLLTAQVDRPNILWITSEDNGPQLGCYGDTQARTPNLDQLARRGLRFENAWSNAPVCAPARTTIITGMYAPSLGAQHMRSRVAMPEGYRLFPQLLREAGYYCVNRAKTDYNLDNLEQVWDQSNHKAHWRGRKNGQPFFAVINFTTTHESATRRRPHTAVQDAKTVKLPDYYPDLPEIRQDWAQYYDQMAVMDSQVGVVLSQLQEDGLADQTIVFYFADHGPGFARGKRWPGDSGMRVPMIVSFPPRYQHLAPQNYQADAASPELVSFVDLAPTILSLAGVAAPSHLQGRAFAGSRRQPEPATLHGFRGRMDERYDMSRSVRDRRYVYIRNYMERLPHGQHLNYLFQTPTTRAWHQAFLAGGLAPKHAQFWLPKAREELYDLDSDPFEIHNLAADPKYAEVLQRLRKANQEHWLRVKDLGFLPEAEMHRRAGTGAPHELQLPLAELMQAADQKLPGAMQHADPAVRFWLIQGWLNRSQVLSAEQLGWLLAQSMSANPSLAVAAADGLIQLAPATHHAAARAKLLAMADFEKQPFFVCVAALNVMDRVSSWTEQELQQMAQIPTESESIPKVMRFYIPRLMERLLSTSLSEKQ